MSDLFFLLVRGFAAAVARLPVPTAYSLCSMLGDVAYLLDAKHRRIGRINLGLVFPDRPRSWHRRVLRTSFREVGIHAAEICRLTREAPDSILRRVRYEAGLGRENYELAAIQGKGVLFLTAHISSWELLPIAHALHCRPLSFVVRPLKNPRLEEWTRQLRERFDNQVIAKQGSVRHLLRALRNQQDVGLLIDQNVQEKDGVYVPLFGTTACTPSAPAALALKTGCPIVAGFLLPDSKRGHYRIRFYPPMDPAQTGSLQERIAATTCRYNRCLEEVIREFPHCWLWGHRRFATQPDGSDPYL